MKKKLTTNIALRKLIQMIEKRTTLCDIPTNCETKNILDFFVQHRIIFSHSRIENDISRIQIRYFQGHAILKNIWFYEKNFSLHRQISNFWKFDKKHFVRNKNIFILFKAHATFYLHPAIYLNKLLSGRPFCFLQIGI